jgi:hypothetical protein
MDSKLDLMKKPENHIPGLEIKFYNTFQVLKTSKENPKSVYSHSMVAGGLDEIS